MSSKDKKQNKSTGTIKSTIFTNPPIRVESRKEVSKPVASVKGK